ncbi:uncharacterized protein LOC109861835 [Pseudomyrmex gracilis]|uniref:uncharacterized protein LOC109861835 n=1 Tax=Pseudomyrmex gracilis TaxID=219809 RepID=UPI0009954EAE|nr:uncharacterized protein LOC109861835 [Pseudomyrmex gracilis]
MEKMDCGELKENKKYAVVKFFSDNSYSEIPTAWLVINGDKELCWWPPRTANASLLITNCTSPTYDSWNLHEVKIVKYCSSLESARKSAADASYQTTDEERLGRGKRQHVFYNRYSSDEEYSDTNANCVSRKAKKKVVNTSAKLSTVPSCPDKFMLNDIYNNNKSVDIINNNDARSDTTEASVSQHYSEKRKNSSVKPDNVQFNIADVPIIIEDYVPSTKVREEAEEDSNIKKYFKQLLRMQATANLFLEDIKQRVSRLEDAIKSSAVTMRNNSDDSLIAQILPLSSIENIKEFESLLKNTDEAVMQFKEFLLKIGGNNLRDTIHRTLSKVFTNDCALKCSWKGIRNNFKVSDLYFVKIMRKIILQHSPMTETEFDNIVAEWLRFAKQRKRREEKGKDIIECGQGTVINS